MSQRASVCLSVDSPEEEAAFEGWLEKWKEKMSFVSDDYGCGCCVHLFDLEGPEEALAELPHSIRTSTDWSEKGIR